MIQAQADPLAYMRLLYRVNLKRSKDKKLNGLTRMRITSSLQVVRYVLDKLEQGCSTGDAILSARLRFNSPNHIRTMDTLEQYVSPVW